MQVCSGARQEVIGLRRLFVVNVGDLVLSGLTMKTTS